MLLRLIFLLLLTLIGWADTPKFQLVTLNIRVYDKFDRPYEVPENTASVGVRLAQGDQQSSKDVAQFETLSCGSIEYPRQTDKYLQFKVKKGVAEVQFVIIPDSSSIDYELVLVENDETRPLSPAIWPIGIQSTDDNVKAESARAPHSGKEIAIIVIFTLGGMALSYWLLGRVLFGRMLRQRNMEVPSALGWSNVLVMLSWALAFVGMGIMIFFPWILWQKLYWIYVVVPAGYALLICTMYGAGHLFTRS